MKDYGVAYDQFRACYRKGRRDGWRVGFLMGLGSALMGIGGASLLARLIA